MRGLVLLVCLVVAAGCSSSGDRGRKDSVPVLTREAPLNRKFAELGVTHCTVAGLPSSNPGAPVKARASLKVASKEASSDPHRARIKVYDPATAELKDPDADGNLLVPVGGALLALTGAGGAAVWFVHDKNKGGHEVDIAGDGDTPVSVSTTRPTDPSRTNVSARTPRGTLDCTPIASTDEAVCALAPLTPGDAGKVDLTATEDGQPVGKDEVTAVSTSIWWVPEVVKPGETGQLVAQFLPAGRNITVQFNLTGGIQQQPVLLLPGQIQGGPGNYTITFQGNSTNLSVPLMTVVGTDQPIEASVEAEEVK